MRLVSRSRSHRLGQAPVLNAFPDFGLFAGVTGSDLSDRFVDRMAHHFVTQHVIVWQRPIGYNFVGRPLSPIRGRQAQAGRSDKTFPIDFAYKFPIARASARCQGVVRVHSTFERRASRRQFVVNLYARIFVNLYWCIFGVASFSEWQGRA